MGQGSLRTRLRHCQLGGYWGVVSADPSLLCPLAPAHPQPRLQESVPVPLLYLRSPRAAALGPEGCRRVRGCLEHKVAPLSLSSSSLFLGGPPPLNMVYLDLLTPSHDPSLLASIPRAPFTAGGLRGQDPLLVPHTSPLGLSLTLGPLLAWIPRPQPRGPCVCWWVQLLASASWPRRGRAQGWRLWPYIRAGWRRCWAAGRCRLAPPDCQAPSSPGRPLAPRGWG